VVPRKGLLAIGCKCLVVFIFAYMSYTAAGHGIPIGGSKPNLADLAVFGVLRPIRHLDTGRDMLAFTKIGEWYSRMEDAVGATARLQEEPLMGTIDSSLKV